MTCYHPLHAFKTGLKTDKGKDLYIVDSHSSPSISLTEAEKKVGRRISPLGLKTGRRGAEIHLEDYIEVPCGHCVGCRLDRSRDWALRCVAESMTHPKDTCFFVTLTYDDDHLEALSKDTLQRFFKRLRHYHDFRYFACGEHGSKTGRPHYHVIFFGLPLDDLKVWGHGTDGILWTSETLSKYWPYGNSMVAEMTFETAAYVARYALKDSPLPSFQLMSRRPGIGSEWITANLADIAETDKVYLPYGMHSQTPPRFYSYLADKLGVDLSSAKERRRLNAEGSQALDMALRGIGRVDLYRNDSESRKKSALKRLKRTL